tara:strand:+ start:230 stop:508 length:279 start_codon:yes stop_codon:yes gene_type:complete
MSTDNDLLKISSECIYVENSDGILILNISFEKYYQLNHTGREIIFFFETANSVMDTINKLSCEYDIEKKLMEKDILCFIEDAKQKGILEIAQ